MTRKILYFILLIISICACEEENGNDIAANQYVVEAFLYAGEPVDDIKIKTTFPLTDEEDTSEPINDASVVLKKEGTTYALVPSGNDGFYHYPGNDLVVATDDIFELEIQYAGITAEAQTIVPSPTRGLQISIDTLKVPRLPFGQGADAIRAAIGDFLMSSTIVATWDNPTNDLYFMTVETLRDTIVPIFPEQVLTALEGFRFVSEPTDGNSLEFLGGTLVSFGTHVIRVYHINQEYAALYENRSQDSRDLNEPPSNIKNALGVFSAFNSQEMFFEVVFDN